MDIYLKNFSKQFIFYLNLFTKYYLLFIYIFYLISSIYGHGSGNFITGTTSTKEFSGILFIINILGHKTLVGIH